LLFQSFHATFSPSLPSHNVIAAAGIKLLKGGQRGGLTGPCRSFGGSRVDATDFVELAEKQIEFERLNPGLSERLSDKIAKSGLSIGDYLMRCNSHLISDPEAAKFIAYFDLNSLYASAGEHTFFTYRGLCRRRHHRRSK
jgi:hypothetical protein